MRTTVDLPAAVHARARELAAERGQSLSALIADLTVRALAEQQTPIEIRISENSGLPIVSIGRRITDADVADLLDDGE